MSRFSVRMADSIIAHKVTLTDHYGYEYGMTLEGILDVYHATQDKKYLDFVITTMDTFVNQDGTVNGYRMDEYNIDHLKAQSRGHSSRFSIITQQHHQPAMIVNGCIHHRQPPKALGHHTWGFLFARAPNQPEPQSPQRKQRPPRTRPPQIDSVS